MSQDTINWGDINREYFELWDWILRECDGDWTREYSGRSPKQSKIYKEKLGRFAEIRKQIDSQPHNFYFCWMKTEHETWCRDPRRRNAEVRDNVAELCRKDRHFTEIDYILYQLQSAPDRYYWFSAISSALQGCFQGRITRKKLNEARDNYRTLHFRYSEVFDLLLKYKGAISEAVGVLNDYLVDLRYLDVKDSVEIAYSFSAIKVDQLGEEQVGAIKRAADEEFKGVLSPKKAKKCCHYSFVFCEADIIYPHRRHHLLPFFSMFVNVAAIDFFYMCISDEIHHSDFSRWPRETTHTIDRWSKEHIDCFKDFFIGYAEQENKKWRDRFEANLDSARPPVAEKFSKCVFQLDKGRNQPRPTQSTFPKTTPPLQPSTGVASNITQRRAESHQAYTRGENLKEAGKRIGKKFNDGTPLSAKTVSRDAEDHAKENGLPFEKRPKGRGRTRPKNP